MMTDPIADMLTRIRNAIRTERPFIEMPTSKMKVGIAGVLQREGYIWDYEVLESTPCDTLRVNLKYGNNGERIISKIARASTPGRRLYVGVDEIPKVLGGLGIAILSTNRGIVSTREAKKEHVGGEVLCTVY